MARAKNRQTFNKMARERELKERRALKQEKKDERRRAAAGEPTPGSEEDPVEAESEEPSSTMPA